MNRHTHTYTHILQEETDSKSYVLCSDTEEEMKAWIAAITEEIKPMMGVGASIYGKKPGKGDEVKIDKKAFDEVCALQRAGHCRT